MTLDANTILSDISMFIPDENVLTDAQMLTLIGYVIAEVGDADSNAAEVKCKSLRTIGQVNLAKASTASAGVKREKVGEEEKEWFDGDGARKAWENFLDSLSIICPIFGYYGLPSKGGIKITPGEDPIINPTCNTSDLEF